MALALLRLGPDRVPPEVWLKRRVRYAWQTRQYVNRQNATRRATSEDDSKQKRKREATSFTSQTVLQPIDFAWDEIGIYPLLTIVLGVVGAYFSAWLNNGGAKELSMWFK